MLLTFDTEIDMSAAEQIMLRSTITELQNRGWKLQSIADGEEEVSINDMDEAIKHIAGVDAYIHLDFIRDGKSGWMVYVPGNGVDCIVDYSTSIIDFPNQVYQELSKFF